MTFLPTNVAIVHVQLESHRRIFYEKGQPTSCIKYK